MVTGDHEDEFIPKDGNEIRLTQDEHFHSAKDRKFRIIVNLEEKVVTKRVLTFSEVVKLAYPRVQDGPDVIYTVTYKRPPARSARARWTRARASRSRMGRTSMSAH